MMRSRRKLTMGDLGVGLVLTTGAMAQENAFLSLKEGPVPVPTAALIPVDPNVPPDSNPIPGPATDLPFQDRIAAGIVKDQAALIRLGKALFWDMQVGSDGVQACATCHFNAGADSRTKNTVKPGGPEAGFIMEPPMRPNHQLSAGDFPFHRLADVNNQHSAVLSERNDVVGAEGVFKTSFIDVVPGSAVEEGTLLADSIY